MSLKEKAVKGVLWSSIGTVGAGLLNFIVTMILARVLSPADYGVLEILLVFIVLAECFIDSGFSQAIIRDNNASEEDLSSVFYLNLFIALALYLILFILSPYIATYYNEPNLLWLSRFVFLTFIFNSFSIVQNANFSRTLDFKTPAISSICAIIISATISIFLAFKGYGVWALAFNHVIYSFLRTVFYWVRSKWRPVLKFSFQSIKRYFKFGSNLLIQGLVDKFVSNFESLLIGKVYTKSDLGYFSQARKLDGYIIQTSSSVIQRVTYPILAKMSDTPEKLKSGYRRVLQTTIFVIAPILFFTISASDNVLYCLFGAQWLESTPYLRLWCFTGFLVSFYSVFINIFLVNNKTKLLLKLSLIRQLIRLVAIVVFIRISIMSLMYTIVVVTLISFFIYVYKGGRLIGYHLLEILRDLYKTLFAASVAGVVVYLFSEITSIDNRFVLLVIQLIIMVFIYLLLSIILKNPIYTELKEIVKSLFK